jgi:hypothetical protein
MANRPRGRNSIKPKFLSAADPTTSFNFEVWFAEQRAKNGEYVTPDELAGIVAGMGDNPLPGWLREQVCSHLRGQAKRPRGRPSIDRNSKEWLDRMLELAEFDYRRVLSFLQGRAKRHGAASKISRKRGPFPDGPPHEVALRVVLNIYRKRGDFKMIDERRFRNLISRK